MIWYQKLFFSRKTFGIASVGAFFLLAASMCLQGLAGQLTMFTIAYYLQNFFMSVGLVVAWKKDDVIRGSGLVGGILLVELCHYTYLSDQYLSIGVDAIVSLGLVQCMLFSAYLMVCCVILMVIYNHFTIRPGKTSGRTKMISNQIALGVLLQCFLVITAERLVIGDQIIGLSAGVLNCLADLCLFNMIACCEVYLTEDGQILNVYRKGE